MPAMLPVTEIISTLRRLELEFAAKELVGVADGGGFRSVDIGIRCVVVSMPVAPSDLTTGIVPDIAS